MTTPIQSVFIRRIIYASGSSSSLSPYFYDSQYDSSLEDILDEVLMYDPTYIIQGYQWDGVRQVLSGGGGDTIAPTVAITSSESNGTSAQPIPVTFTFSEAVTGFTVGDITVGQGTAGNFATVSPSVYTCDVTSTGVGPVTVDVAADVCQDSAGNGNLAADQFSITLAYFRKILHTQSANLIQYLRLNDTSGATAQDSSAENNDGTYGSVELANAAGPDGINCAHFTGSSYVSLLTAGFASDFNKDELTVMVHLKAENAGLWADGTARALVRIQSDNGTEYLYIYRSATLNRLTVLYTVGGVARQINIATTAPTDWVNIAVTVSKSADEMKVYYNGSQSGTTQTGLGQWSAAALYSERTNIGAYQSSPSVVEAWSGWLSHCAVWKVALSPAEVSAINP